MSCKDYMHTVWYVMNNNTNKIVAFSKTKQKRRERKSPVNASNNAPTLLLLLFIAFIQHYSLLLSRLDAHMSHVILNEWLYPFIARIINIHGSGVLVALCGCCMAGATWNAAVSAQVPHPTFHIQPATCTHRDNKNSNSITYGTVVTNTVLFVISLWEGGVRNKDFVWLTSTANI